MTLILTEREQSAAHLAQAQEEIEKLRVLLSGAEARQKLLLDAKNHWADRARAAEALCQVGLKLDSCVAEFDGELKYCQEWFDAFFRACDTYRASLSQEGGENV